MQKERQILAAIVAIAWSVRAAVDIIPTPKECHEGSLRLRFATAGRPAATIVVGDACSPRDRIAADYLVKECQRLLGDRAFRLPVVRAGELTATAGDLIVIGCPWENALVRQCMEQHPRLFTGKWQVTKDNPGEQGYVVRFVWEESERTVAILAGSDSQGTLHAVMSFLFLIKRSGNDLVAREASIRDWPDFKVRLLGRDADVDWAVRHKINMVGGIGLDSGEAVLRDADRLRQQCEYARARGIRVIAVGHHTMGQKGPEGLRCHRGKRTYQSKFCIGHPGLMQKRVELIKRITREIGPGAFYIHGIDIAAGGLHGLIHRAWKTRCAECRRRWPSDEMISMRGRAGAVCHLINTLHRAACEEPGGEDAILYFVTPPYPIVSHSKEQIREICRYWHLITQHVPADVRLCAREVCEEHARMLALCTAKRQSLLMYLISGQMKSEFWAFPCSSYLAKTFYQPDRPRAVDFFLAIKCCPEGLVRLAAAEYAWNCSQPGSAKLKGQAETYRYFRTPGWKVAANSDPHIRDVLIPKFCRRIYGNAAAEMAEAIRINPQLFQFDSALMMFRARGGKFLDRMVKFGKAHFRELGEQHYPPVLDRYAKAYPFLKVAWLKAREDRLVSERCKRVIFNWLFYSGMGLRAAEALMNVSLAWSLHLGGKAGEAADYLTKAEAATQGLRDYEEDAFTDTDWQAYDRLYGNPPGREYQSRYVDRLETALAKVQIGVRHLAEASRQLVSAKDRVNANAYADALTHLAAARAALAKPPELANEAQKAEYGAARHRLVRELDDTAKWLNWKRTVFSTQDRAAEPATIRVALYNADADGGVSLGEQGILEAFAGEPGLRLELIADLAASTLAAFDVVVFPGINRIGKSNPNWRQEVRAYVANGGGAVFTHHGCGGRKPYHVYTFGDPLFPQIVTTVTDRSEIAELTVTREHPVTKGLAVGSKFKHAYYDHLRLKPGPKGEVLVRDPDPVAAMLIGDAAAAGDNPGEPVIVVGGHGKGRVVYMGNIPGFGDGRQNVERAPRYGEYQVLLNAIKWAGGG